MEQIKNLLPKTPQALESFEEILTQEEIENVLSIAREEKRVAIRTAAYNEKLRKEHEEISVSSDKYFLWVVKKAKENIPGFTLNKDEEKIYKMLAMYFTKDKEFEKNGLSLKKGLFLWGKYGCGKTTIMKNFMENPLESFGVVSSRKVSDIYKEQGSEIVYKYSKSPSICFDDLGTEIEDGLKSHFGSKKNVMADIMLNYYDNNSSKVFRMHFTTNLNGDQLEENYGGRVRSRLREMCNIISLEGINDKRK